MDDFKPITTTSPEPSETPESTTAPGFGSSDTDHFDDVLAGLPPEAGAYVADEAESAAPPEPETPPGCVSKDQFFTAFRALFAAPNIIIRPPLQSLAIDPTDAEARAASDALYDTCVDVPWLQWLIRPESKWAERAAVVAIFAFGKYQAIRAEIAARERSRGASGPAGGPAPNAEDAAPPEPETKPVKIVGREYDGVLGSG